MTHFYSIQARYSDPASANTPIRCTPDWSADIVARPDQSQQNPNRYFFQFAVLCEGKVYVSDLEQYLKVTLKCVLLSFFGYDLLEFYDLD